MRTLDSLQSSFQIDLHTHSLLYVDSTLCTLHLFSCRHECKQLPCSTAKNGLGSEEHSEKTPLGLHRITAKIGENAPKGAVFSSRQWTGEVWTPDRPDRENMILSRILRLEGLEENLNSGGSVDSFNRYIYIHGTNQETAVGHRNISHGCILLTNDDIITLFDLVKEGDYVYID